MTRVDYSSSDKTIIFLILDFSQFESINLKMASKRASAFYF